MEFIKTAETEGLPRIVSIQNAYNLTDWPFKTGMDEICFRENIGLIAHSPLAFGQPTGKYLDNPKVCGRLALAWCYSRRFINATIIGGMKPEHLKENIDAIPISSSDEIVDRINEIYSLIINPGL